MYILFDIGGTKTRIATSKDLESFSEPTIFPTPQSFEEGIEAMVKTARELSDGENIELAAVGNDIFVIQRDVGIFKLPNGVVPPVPVAPALQDLVVLAASSDGNLYVGETPSGILWEVHPDGSTEVFSNQFFFVSQLSVSFGGLAVQTLVPVADTYVKENSNEEE